jgi:hypothetical protein
MRTYKCLICIATMLLLGCNPPVGDKATGDPANSIAKAEPAAEPQPAPNNEEKSWVAERDGMRVTRAGFESRELVWPLTVDAALIGCERPELLWVEAAGRRYGINGMGRIHLKLERFDEIWLFDEEMAALTGAEEVRVSPSDLMNEARKLCGRS